MILLNLALFALSLFVLVKSADYGTKYSYRIARILRLPEFIVSFFIVAVISCLPEGTISVLAAMEGSPEFGLGTLLGSNVADLTLVFGIVALFSFNGIQIKSTLIKKDIHYVFLLVFSVILGLDGNFTRIDGLVLILLGFFFFFTLSLQGHMFKAVAERPKDLNMWKNLGLLLLSLAFLLIGAHYTIEFGTRFAYEIGLPVIIITLTFVAIGTCLPEMMFAIKAVKANHENLALGDILGTVIIDATIILGIMVLIRPFEFDPIIIYITGTAMALAAILVIIFSRMEKTLTKKEGIYLIFFYLLYLVVEFIGNHLIRVG